MDVPRKASKDDREILVVEDSPTQAERLKYILEQHGYKISVARNGREALAKISQRLPLVVISDIMMPEMDGYQVCRQIKGDDKLKEVPVILLTSLADPVDVVPLPDAVDVQQPTGTVRPGWPPRSGEVVTGQHVQLAAGEHLLDRGEPVAVEARRVTDPDHARSSSRASCPIHTARMAHR